MSGMWFTEEQTANIRFGCRIRDILHSEKTDFQDLAVIDTLQWGRMLLLDNLVMTTDKDEFVYHEMISHVAMNSHPNPQKVLVIGGGDGGTIREVVKHEKVEKAVLCEIDGQVIEASKKYFPEIASVLTGHPKVEILVADGIKHVKEMKEEYDVILVDSSEPIGPGAVLFTAEFYQAVSDALKPDGIMVAQTESPFYNQELIQTVFPTINSIFPITKLYLASIPTYPSGLWSFTIGSKKYDPEQVNAEEMVDLDTKYYTPSLHKAAFALPRFVRKLTEGK
ncbi:polyamine aminopropyltransferase [Heliorestis acidaminivorans]|uniref:Polyamine aminopropyltransferase n=1 Tax=Heliorestis acidaminivorans TaxID=553427 RepID=A0A6I0F3Z2_9FIRM|nr:polyamine aminopropyltransferase [Heliorestis acidaminivorans]KAB2951861.1 polyamine aminopropyltransferase [Heliorestis acidaminivorans]